MGLAVLFTAPPHARYSQVPWLEAPHSLPPSRRPRRLSRDGRTEEEAAVGLAVFFTVCCIWGDVGRHLSPP